MKTKKAHIALLFSLLPIIGGGHQLRAQDYDTTPSSPCPEVLIEQKYDHEGSLRYRQMGWDTAVTCDVQQIILRAEPYIPVQYFNGTYVVTRIPYNPPDSTFSAGTRMPISTDDDFAASSTAFPPQQVVLNPSSPGGHDTIPAFMFYFFGIAKSGFRLGANGLVTFSSWTGSNSCPWQYSAGLPWPDGTSGMPSNSNNRMRDAIYGIYEDTYPSPSIHGPTPADWGIYYGIQDDFPCRKIICSWNDVPQYQCTQLRCSYQIACYEGSNIIEVHVKQRQVCTGWNGGNGIIGIQNATGQPQQPDTGLVMQNGVMTPKSNYRVVSGSPAAFFPTSLNPFTSNLAQTAYRFTPQGTTQYVARWYRVFDDGREPVELTTNQMDIYDTNKYAYIQMEMDQLRPFYKTRTELVVQPKVTAKYMLQLRFQNANRDWYDLRDTITIGRDTLIDTYIYANTQSVAGESETVERVCHGTDVTVHLDYPSPQLHDTISWTITRMLNGQEVSVPTDEYTISSNGRKIDVPPFDTTRYSNSKIDTLIFTANVHYVSGCYNNATMMVLTYPNFDITDSVGICMNETFKWHANGQTYTTSDVATNAQGIGWINDQIMLHSAPGCDSLMRLSLKVMDVSHTLDTRVECHSIKWRNGQTYTESNTATFDRDTVRLTNAYGCDSIVQLDLTVIPLTVKMYADLDEFDYDHLTVNLTDLSTGADHRQWLLPSGNAYTAPVAQYTIPADLDKATIRLIAYSAYGCADSTKVTIPFNKETFWMPNVFTPGNPQGNNLFGSHSTQTNMQRMIIYNRRGERVFECEGADCAWDGRDLDGNALPQGAYVYIIRYSTVYHPEETITKTGTVTLLR